MTDIVILVLTSFIGYFLASALDKRGFQLEWLFWDLAQFASEYCINVRRAKCTLDGFLSSNNARYVDTVKKLMHSSYTAKLTKDDSLMIQQFLSGLVANNSLALIEHLEQFKTIFSDRYNSLNKANCNTRSISKKVGLLLGVVVGLLLV